MLSGLTFGSKKELEKQFREEAEREKARKREEKKLSKKQKKVSEPPSPSPMQLLHACADDNNLLQESKKNKKDKHKKDRRKDRDGSSSGTVHPRAVACLLGSSSISDKRASRHTVAWTQCFQLHMRTVILHPLL